jgi:hypothetical protein
MISVTHTTCIMFRFSQSLFFSARTLHTPRAVGHAVVIVEQTYSDPKFFFFLTHEKQFCGVE